MTVGEASEKITFGHIYKKGYYPDCWDWTRYKIPAKHELPDTFVIACRDSDLTFERLQEVSKIFKTKNINVVSDIEHGYYDETYHKLLLEVTLT